MKTYKPIIVLDDDPTGTQTVHGIPVVTDWSMSTLKELFLSQTPLFYILTNSRAFVESKAAAINKEIGENIRKLKQDAHLISRSDSTLRGHFPAETEALASGLGWDEFIYVLAPVFIEGKRYTKGDVHYLLEDGEWIPVGETPYAKDETFGYKASNLKDWIVEKSNSNITKEAITSISIEALESASESELLQIINNTKKALILNATKQKHLIRFSEIVKKSAKNIIFRSGASIVSAMGGIQAKPFLGLENLKTVGSKNGGIIIIGSHVPKSTAQLNALLSADIHSFEFDVSRFLKEQDKYVKYLSKSINQLLGHSQHVLLYTSRDLKTGGSKEESLELSVRVGKGLIAITKGLKQSPAFFIAKGGITSSNLATDALGVKKAMVIGQVEAGVPVWKLGKESKFPGMNYVVFPGNVGSIDSLRNLYEKLK